MEVKRIMKSLVKQGDVMETALFHTAIDSMLRSSDLLKLRVETVMYQSGAIKEVFSLTQSKTGRKVTIVLLEPTRKWLKRLIQEENKQFGDYLFTVNGLFPIHPNWYRRIVKKWAKFAGITNVEEYSGHSTRRTKAMFLYRRGVKLGTISKALGHKNLTATILYLGIEEQEVVNDLKQNSLWRSEPEPEDVLKQHSLWRPLEAERFAAKTIVNRQLSPELVARLENMSEEELQLRLGQS